MRLVFRPFVQEFISFIRVAKRRRTTRPAVATERDRLSSPASRVGASGVRDVTAVHAAVDFLRLIQRS